jgi:hypothetical protein
MAATTYTLNHHDPARAEHQMSENLSRLKTFISIVRVELLRKKDDEFIKFLANQNGGGNDGRTVQQPSLYEPLRGDEHEAMEEEYTQAQNNNNFADKEMFIDFETGSFL